MRVANWALKLADRLILQRYVTLSVVGVYSVGYMLGGTVFDLVASSVNSAILPFVYQTAREEREDSSKRTFADLAAWNAALLGGLGLVTILFAHEVILLLTTSAYLEAEAIVPYVVWASIFQALAHVPTRAIYLVKKTAYLPLTFVVPAVLNVGLNFALIPRWGALGAAAATLAAYPVLFGLTLAVAQRVYPIPYDYWRMAKPLLILLALCLVKGALATDSLLIAVALKCLVLLAFPLALVASGFVTAAEWRRLMAIPSLAARRPGRRRRPEREHP